jgi:hypothetical protein
VCIVAKNLRQETRCPGRVSISGLPEYEAGTPTNVAETFLSGSVLKIIIQFFILIIIIIIRFFILTCLTTARYGQLQPSSKTTVQNKNNVLKSANALKIKN